MNYEEFNNLAGGIASAATVLALAVGGFWTYNRFVKQREKFPFIEFTVDIFPVGKQGDWWIVELIAYIENKGKVQHRIRDFDFHLVALSEREQVTISEEWGNQVDFKETVARGSWLPKKAKFFFVDPGVKAKYSYIARVPAGRSFLNLHARFVYLDQEASHTAERTIEMPRSTQSVGS